MIDATWSAGWKEVRALVWQERRVFGAGVGLMLLNRTAALVVPASAKLVVDQVVGRDRPSLLPIVAGAITLALLVEGATGAAMMRLLGVGAQRSVTTLRRTLARHVIHLPLRDFDRTHSGIVIARLVNDSEQVQYVVGMGLVQVAGGTLTAVVALGILSVVDWRLAAVVMSVLCAAGCGLWRLFRRLDADYRAASDATAAFTARLADTLGAIGAVKAACAERAHAGVLARAAHQVHRAMVRTVADISLFSAMSAIVTGALGMSVLLLGGHAVLAGRLTLGDLTLLVLLVGTLTTPLVQVVAYASEVGRAAGALARLHELRALPTETREDQSLRPARRLIGHVALERVSFAYRSGRLVLRDIDLDLPAGSTTLLVGRSGAGKSTLCRLVLAFDRPTSGRVLIDGYDLSMVRRDTYRRQLGVVLQDGVLLDGSVADNIRAGRAWATAAEVRRAGRLAHCDEFVESLPGGYDATVGERGVWLSGGQRQRVAIARAILADPRILVFDEATASLDAESERCVRAALATLLGGRTALVIAHGASAIDGADQLVELDAGRVVALEKGGSGEEWRRRQQNRPCTYVKTPSPATGGSVSLEEFARCHASQPGRACSEQVRHGH